MYLKLFLLFFVGLCSGGIIAAGVFAFITTIGLVPRLAGKTHTAKHMRLYEDCIVLGATLGNAISLFQINFYGNTIIYTIFGIFSGVFVGSLIMSLAETLNALPTINRRIRLALGIQYVILSIALGKGVGTFLYFFFDMSGK